LKVEESLKVEARGRMSLSLSAARAQGVERTRRPALRQARTSRTAARERSLRAVPYGLKAFSVFRLSGTPPAGLGR
jgi:hypothetical protein